MGRKADPRAHQTCLFAIIWNISAPLPGAEQNGFCRKGRMDVLGNSAFGVVGGDQRQIYLARSIARDGYPVYISCLEQGEGIEELPSLELERLPEACGTVILPLPVTRDGKYLNTALSQRKVPLDDGFASLFLGKQVYGGMMEKLYRSSQVWDGICARDYYDREELTMGNAFLTAEGALGVAIGEYSGALNGSHCLVTGFGRIGKVLCLALKGLGAQVDCCARKAGDLTAIRAIGCRPLQYREVRDAYDVVFNTVPAQVLGAQQLSRQRPDTLIIELASQPGGVDLEAAKRLGLRVKDEPSIPGRMSPKTSGELVKEAVYNMMEEA